jgi:hypothetical protein
MAKPGQNLSIEMTPNGDVRVTLHHPRGRWVVDCAAGTHPMVTIETPSGNCHDVVLGKDGDIVLHGLGRDDDIAAHLRS